MFLLTRTDGKYVADMRQSNDSHTYVLRKAKVFRTKEQADKDRCMGSESIITLESQLPSAEQWG